VTAILSPPRCRPPGERRISLGKEIIGLGMGRGGRLLYCQRKKRLHNLSKVRLWVPETAELRCKR